MRSCICNFLKGVDVRGIEVCFAGSGVSVVLVADALEGPPDVTVCEVVLSEFPILRTGDITMRFTLVAEPVDVVLLVAVTVIESLVERLIESDLLEKVVLISARLGRKVLDIKVEVDCTLLELLLIPEADRTEFPLTVVTAIRFISDDVVVASLLEVMILDPVEEKADLDESSISNLARYNSTHQHIRTHSENLIVTGCWTSFEHDWLAQSGPQRY